MFGARWLIGLKIAGIPIGLSLESLDVRGEMEARTRPSRIFFLLKSGGERTCLVTRDDWLKTNQRTYFGGEIGKYLDINA